MAQFVLIVLSGLHAARKKTVSRLDVDFDFSANTSCLIVVLHEIVQLLNCVLVRSRSYIKHQSVLGFQVLADALEEPFVRVNFSVVALLDTEHEVDSAALKNRIIDAKVPSCALETVQNVAWDIVGVDVRVHDITHVLHLEVAVAISFHEALLEEHLLVKEAFFAGKCLESRLQVVVAVNDDHNQEVVLREVCLRINLQTVVVVQAASQRVLQLLLLFVVHGDADGELWILSSNLAPLLDNRHHRSVFDLPGLSTWPEARRAQLSVLFGLRQHDGLVRNVDCWLPHLFFCHISVALKQRVSHILVLIFHRSLHQRNVLIP